MVRGGVGGAAADQPPNAQVSVEEARSGVGDLDFMGFYRDSMRFALSLSLYIYIYM